MKVAYNTHHILLTLKKIQNQREKLIVTISENMK